MPLKSQAGIGLGHTLTIVNHLYQCATAVCHNNLNFRSTGINGILDKFLYNRRGALHNLACRNLIGHRIW